MIRCKRIIHLFTHHYSLITLFTLFLFISCVSVKYVSIEQYVPAPYPLPRDIRVGVLNNFSPHNVAFLDDGIYAYSLDGDSVMEYVAQAFADEELFDEVVVLDSCIYPRGDTIYHLLTEQEVQRLCDTLAVDILYVCDYGCVTSWGPEAIDGQCEAYFASHIFVPGRTEPTHSFILNHFLRHGTYRNRAEVERWTQRSYPLVGTMAVQRLAPHWETCDRSFYHSTAYNMREATVCVRDGDWDGAYRHWQRQERNKTPRQRLISLYNQALYHEMNDSIDLALRCLDLADTYAADTTAVDSVLLREWYDADFHIGEYPFTDHQRITDYRKLLHNREDEINKLAIGGDVVKGE